MKKFLVGMLIGMLIGATAAYAAVTYKILLIDSSGQYIGTASNPLNVTT